MVTGGEPACASDARSTVAIKPPPCANGGSRVYLAVDRVDEAGVAEYKPPLWWKRPGDFSSHLRESSDGRCQLAELDR